MAKVLVLYCSMYGHIKKMADAIAEGVRAVDGVETTIKRKKTLTRCITNWR